MNINATLFGQMLTFAIFIWFTWKFVWPPLTKMMEQRQKTIADGLAAAEQGVRALEAAHHKADQELRDAKIKAANILEEVNKRSALIIDEARDKARQEGERIINLAQAEIKQQLEKAKQTLREQMAGLVVASTEKLLNQKIDKKSNEALLIRLIEEI